MTPHVTLPEGALREICDRYRIRRLLLFGLLLRENSPYFKDQVLKEAEVQYVAA